MARITKAELENRVTKVTDLLLKGAKRAQVLQFAGKLNWKVSDSMVDKYIGQATEAIRESAVVDRDYEVALAKERYEYLYTQSVSGKDYRGALSVIQSKSKLLGLDAPTRTDITSGGKDLTQIGLNIVDYRANITEVEE
jgi:hypothetical protein